MNLEPATIAALSSAASGVIAGALTYAAAPQPEPYRRALRLWSLGLLIGPLGWALLEAATLLWWLAIPGKTLMFGACALYLRALLVVQHRALPDALLLAGAAAVASLTLAYAWAWPLLPMRTALLSLLCTAACIWAVVETVAERPLGRGARIVAAAMALSALVWLVRGFLLYMPEASDLRWLIAGDTSQSLTLGLAMLLPAAGTLGIVLMGNERLLARLDHLARHDGLTGVLNRAPFLERLDAMLRETRASRGSLGLLLVDCDHFKQINDRFGHDVGDRALCLVADAIASELRQHDLLCRYGGEEFAVALADADDTQACRVAERIGRTVAGVALLSGGHPVPLRVSTGVATSAANGRESIHGLIRRADLAMYAAKAGGRNRSHLAAPAAD